MSPLKINLAFIFGGKSAEHDISIRSANNILKHIDQELYNIILIAINKSGQWFVHKDGNNNPYLTKNTPLSIDGFEKKVALCLDGTGRIYLPETDSYLNIDLAHPVLHGPYGEDGTIQGLFKTAQLPYVGPDVLGSSVGMDKEIMKRILRDNGIDVGQFVTVYKSEKRPSFNKINELLSMPVFIKPVNMGSSIGIHKVYNEEQYYDALEDAFQYDRKVIIEANIIGREIECAVLGNENPKASLPGEVILNEIFYDFNTKYIDDSGANLQIPAKLPPELIENIQKIAIQSFKALACEGLARVDFFIREDHSILVNEINTLPGFTSISMYPMMWIKTGFTFEELLKQLYHLATERHLRDK